MLNASNVANRLLARRQQIHEQEITNQSMSRHSSISGPSPQYYLLFFGDNEERVILQESKI